MANYAATPESTGTGLTEGFHKVQFFGEQSAKGGNGQTWKEFLFKLIKEDGTLGKDCRISCLTKDGKFRIEFWNDFREALGMKRLGAEDPISVPDLGQVPVDFMTPVLAFFKKSEKESTWTDKETGLEKKGFFVNMALFNKGDKVFKALNSTEVAGQPVVVSDEAVSNW